LVVPSERVCSMRVKGPSAAGEGVMSSMVFGSSIRAVGGGVGDQVVGVVGRGAGGTMAESMAARRFVLKCLRRGQDSSVEI
jgi:hypothetical protein